MQNLIFILVLLLIGKCLSYAKDFPEDIETFSEELLSGVERRLFDLN